MPKTIGGLGLVVCNCMASAADISLNTNFGKIHDSDYIYFSDGHTAYICGDYYAIPHDGSTDIHTVYSGTTIWLAQYSELVLCCEDSGYWLTYGNVNTLPAAQACPAEYDWVSLGNQKYCRAQKNALFDRCKDSGTTGTSGIITATKSEGCTYSAGNCGSFTHCAPGYYKNGTACTKCPDNGTTSDYTNSGITACYLPDGSTGKDSTGDWSIQNGTCPYIN